MIAENIKKLRDNTGLSQAKFAERIGVSRDVVANLEYGRLANPDTKMPLIRLIAKEFEVPVDWILNGEGEPPLPDMTEAEQEAMEMGKAMNDGDPVVKAFLHFWSQRSKAEREALSKALYDFAAQIVESQK